MANMQIRLTSLAPSAAAAGLVIIASAALTGCGPVRAGAAHPAAASHPAASGHPAATGRSARFVCAAQGTVSA